MNNLVRYLVMALAGACWVACSQNTPDARQQTYNDVLARQQTQATLQVQGILACLQDSTRTLAQCQQVLQRADTAVTLALDTVQRLPAPEQAEAFRASALKLLQFYQTALRTQLKQLLGVVQQVVENEGHITEAEFLVQQARLDSLFSAFDSTETALNNQFIARQQAFAQSVGLQLSPNPADTIFSPN
jgi:hypothetical protein